MLYCVLLVILADCHAETGTVETPQQRLTLILEFENQYAATCLDWMNSELNQVFERTGMAVGTRLGAEVASGEIFQRLAIIKFKGGCHVNRQIARSDPGPLGEVQRVDGDILPFINVYCERIHEMIREELRVDAEPERIRKFGRALARVVAHELYHVFSQTVRHTKTGITKTAFNAQDLLADRLGFDEERIYMMAHPAMVRRNKAVNRTTTSFRQSRRTTQAIIQPLTGRASECGRASLPQQ
jgi:hypothetical protein